MRTNVYVDGFNLYYGCLKGTPYRWLDLKSLAERLLKPGHKIHRIRYFTARVKPRPTDPSQHVRQETYLRAIQTLPHLSVHFGHFLSHPRRMPLANPAPGGPRTAEVLYTEEKGSDVNLATFLVVDGYSQDFDAAVVISNDSDLKTPIVVVRQNLKKTVGILCPFSTKPSIELKKAATFRVPITQASLAASQFPAELTDAQGRTIRKPRDW